MKFRVLTTVFITIFCANDVLAQTKGMQPIIDSHVHVKTTADDYPKPFEEYLEENKEFNLKYVFGITMADQGVMDETRARNDSLFSLAKKYPQFVPVCSVHPYDGHEAILELDRIVALGGKIIKLHPISQNFEILDQRVTTLVEAAGERNLIVLMDGFGLVIGDYLEDLLKLVLFNKKTNFIIAHMGGYDFTKLMGHHLVRRYHPYMFDNLWFDFSATVIMAADSPFQDQLEWIIRTVGTDRVLFGSDDPTGTLTETMEAFDKYNFTAEERNLILYNNAAKLLRLD
ncbi:MAG: amidohydrolase family protein [Tannerella sp.]|jgi:predicted TIM-barrel fold metal-dependent hydrolase|nr:amidohydrolase family protein [Tannerella sp.]